MIITDKEEIYEKVEVGDILCVYTDSYKRDKIIRRVIKISPCEFTGCGWGCKNHIYLEDHDEHCFQYGRKETSEEFTIIKYLIKLEDFLKEEEFML
jgi:hypothetical protein